MKSLKCFDKILLQIYLKLELKVSDYRFWGGTRHGEFCLLSRLPETFTKGFYALECHSRALFWAYMPCHSCTKKTCGSWSPKPCWSALAVLHLRFSLAVRVTVLQKSSHRKISWHWYHFNRLRFFCHDDGDILDKGKLNTEWPWEKKVTAIWRALEDTNKEIIIFFSASQQVTSNSWNTKGLPRPGMWRKLNVLWEKYLYGVCNS